MVESARSSSSATCPQKPRTGAKKTGSSTPAAQPLRKRKNGPLLLKLPNPRRMSPPARRVNPVRYVGNRCRKMLENRMLATRPDRFVSSARVRVITSPPAATQGGTTYSTTTTRRQGTRNEQRGDAVLESGGQIRRVDDHHRRRVRADEPGCIHGEIGLARVDTLSACVKVPGGRSCVLPPLPCPR